MTSTQSAVDAVNQSRAISARATAATQPHSPLERPAPIVLLMKPIVREEKVFSIFLGKEVMYSFPLIRVLIILSNRLLQYADYDNLFPRRFATVSRFPDLPVCNGTIVNNPKTGDVVAFEDLE